MWFQSKKKIFPIILVLISLGLLAFTLNLSPGLFRGPFSIYFPFLLPPLVGFLTILLGVGIYYYLYPRMGLIPLLSFHLLVGNLLILYPFYEGTNFLYSLYLLCLTFIPATLLHSTFLVSDLLVNIKKSIKFFSIPYLVCILLGLTYFLFIYKNISPMFPRGLVFGVLIIIFYFLWIGRLVWLIKRPRSELEKLMVKPLFLGQALLVFPPLCLLALLLILGVTLPVNYVSPLVLLFPLALLAGINSGQRSQMQMYIVQSEKRVALGDLLAGLAHELNNPLTFVYSSIEPLQESLNYLKGIIEHPDEKTLKVFNNLDKMVKNMEEGMLRAQKLIQKFRDIPSGKKPPKEEIDLGQLLDKCINLLAHKWKDRIEIERRFEKTPKIVGNPGELEQAFTNLISNACDSTPEGGWVQVSTFEANAGVKVVICDSGSGIPKEVIGRIFDPFFTTKGQGEGEGLGLAITLQIIKSHRGSVEVKSSERKGTEFLIFIPY